MTKTTKSLMRKIKRKVQEFSNPYQMALRGHEMQEDLLDFIRDALEELQDGLPAGGENGSATVD